MTNLQPTAQTGALTLVLLVKRYRSQMIALLVKNGIVVNDNASDEQITALMSNLLKVSKSYSQDLTDFITNPSVADALLDDMTQTAQYFQMSGDDFFNFTKGEVPPLVLTNSAGKPYGSSTTDPALPKPSGTEPKKGFLEGFNLPDFLNQSMTLFGQVTQAKSDADVANAHAVVATAGAGTGAGTGAKNNDKPKEEGLSTTTIVVLSLVGVGLLGTIIYFVTRPKK